MTLIRQMAVGRPVYKTFIDHQPPGIILVGVPFIWIFGNTVLAAKVHTLLFSSLFIGAVYIVGKRVTGLWQSAVLAAGIAGYFATAYAIRVGVNVNSQAAILTTLGLACAVYFRLTASPFRRGASAVLGGLLVGLAFVTKPSVALEVPALLLIIFALDRKARPVWLFLVSCIVAVVLVGLYFAATGTFHEMLATAIGTNLSYNGAAAPAGSGLATMLADRLHYVQEVFVPDTLPYLSALLLGSVLSVFWLLRASRPWPLLLIGLLLWALLALVDSAAALGLHARYFFHIFAPFGILFAWPWRELLRRRGWSLGFGLASLLLLPLVSPLSYNPALPSGKQTAEASDYAQSISFLRSRLAPNDCLLNWSPDVIPVYYFTDYTPCSRVVLQGVMMIDKGYDIRDMRRQFLQDILSTHPKMMVLGGQWNFFPQLERFTNNHLGPELYLDNTLKASYHALDWSNFYESTGSINDEIRLRGYDLLPGRSVQPGTALHVILYWEAAKRPARDYQGFVQLITTDHRANIISDDGPVTAPPFPTDRWDLPGEIVLGRPISLPLPNNLASGDYELVTGMYRLDNANKIQPLPHFDNATGQTVPFISLGKITVRPS